MTMRSGTKGNPQQSRIYLIGSGIASLAAAAYLVKDAGVPGRNIQILEKANLFGGALDGAGEADRGFVIRGECTNCIMSATGTCFPTFLPMTIQKYP